MILRHLMPPRNIPCSKLWSPEFEMKDVSKWDLALKKF